MNNTQEKATPLPMLILGPALMLMTLLTPPFFEGMSVTAWHTLGLALWMATWWISEATPVSVTAFLPLIVAPIVGIAPIKVTTSSYAHPLIFLFLGGFFISIAMERWNLHKRIALKAMSLVSTKPSHQIGGLMLVTAFLSMWMSNTATAVMMLPIALSIIEMVKQKQHGDNHESFSKAMLLAIAFSASIGGLATLIGTPPNALMAAYLADSYDIEIGFAQWMIVGVPLTTVLLILCWFILTKVCYQVNTGEQVDTHTMFNNKLQELGQMSKGEKLVLFFFAFAALGWIFRPLIAKATGLAISDTGIAMLVALLLFVVPVDSKKDIRILAWDDTKRLPWGVLLLFGGGLALASLIKKSGLAAYIATQLEATSTFPVIAAILVVTITILFLTEVTSNTATAASFLPLLGPIAVTLTDGPMMLVIPAALAASCAFMMPVATPPNAIVFSSGELRIKDMARAGLWLNIAAIAIIALLMLTTVPMVFNL
ncbi:SLC13 family permease [Litorilituus sediminis]|uniref:DASS family sodium-coupled anion symporter n=1 Tax=Litorilituus sediminis TaxID=718192 RepID=A0A4P6P1R4_9GAMM|nr:DASS family sodium-coupled anion symporter [Litorilituus sediminis]QBG34488.1 DASS family sodium-coupled anion symporter [Litorilituus sediminis]